MARISTQLGTAAVCALAALAIPRPAAACSIDAGAWVAAMEAGAVSGEVPKDGALVVRLVCAYGPSCADAPEHAGGRVLSPEGAVVAGSWRVLANNVLTFAPSAPWREGTGYKVELPTSRNAQGSFDVVAAIGQPALTALSAQLVLGALKLEDDPASKRCCDDHSSCGLSCYATRELERGQLIPKIDRGAFPAAALAQLELSARSSDGSESTSCVGCAELPALTASEAQASYCVELSARFLLAHDAVSIGRVCTSSGYSELRTLATPDSKVPSACRVASDAGVPQASAPTDAGVPRHTGLSDPAFDDAAVDGGEHDETTSTHSDDLPTEADDSGGCALSGAVSPRASTLLPLLLGLCWYRRRRS